MHKLGIKGGVNAAAYHAGFTYTDIQLKNSFLWAFHAGLFHDTHLKGNFSLQPELLFSLKGTKEKLSYSYRDDSGQEQFQKEEGNDLFYMIEIPIYFKLNLPIKENGKFIAGIGPYFGWGFSIGRILEDFFKDNGSIFSFDSGLAGFIGYEFRNRYSLSLAYEHGFTNIYRKSEYDERFYTRTLSLSLGYKFLAPNNKTPYREKGKKTVRRL
ncbi:MAG: PorT family protein [Candidatus Azobacteroides sp.]|nr:PorT family protein [Candidatus Azobacteroides sp.]